ncbi:MAG: prolipoprotein diacylglyceryl transferase family protein, partial [Sphingomonas sp.]
LFAILSFLFWKSDARYYPGRLVRAFLLGYGGFRYFVEFFREPDQQYAANAILGTPGMHMGQLLCLPMIAGGIYLIATSKKRRERVEPIAGDASVA